MIRPFLFGHDLLWSTLFVFQVTYLVEMLEEYCSPHSSKIRARVGSIALGFDCCDIVIGEDNGSILPIGILSIVKEN